MVERGGSGGASLQTRAGGSPAVAAGSFELAYGEPLTSALDLRTWAPAERLGEYYARLEEEVAAAITQERALRRRTRTELLARLSDRSGAPRCAGVYAVGVGQLRRFHTGVLFTGQVNACDGVARVHDTLPLTVAQIGVCLVSYHGDLGTWTQRLFRRDLHLRGENPVDAALAVLQIRQAREAAERGAQRDTLAALGRRGILSYAERAVLSDQATAPWRLGHGQPAPLELLTGSGSMELMRLSLELLCRLIEDHRRFVFVPSTSSDRVLLTVGEALNPLEIAVIDTMQTRWQRMIDGGYYDAPERQVIERFVKELGPQVVVGAFRASAAAPAQLFYAHVDHAEEAGAIALADAALQQRSFPLLLEVAGLMCRSSFGMDALEGPVQTAYAEAGEPWRYRGRS